MTDKPIELIFLIQNQISFLSGALKNFLEEDEINTMVITGRTLETESIKEFAPFVITDAEILLDDSELRERLYDLCIERNSQLIPIGEPHEINSLMEVTSEALVAEKFTRPFNAKEAAEKIEELLSVQKNKELRKKIIIVDDSPTFLRTAMGWFEEDYNVNICPSAAAAFHLIEVQRPDLILLDYEMPICSGAQFLEMLRSESANSNIPVIFLTSRSDPETVKEVLSLRPQGYILKTQPQKAILRYVRDYFIKNP